MHHIFSLSPVGDVGQYNNNLIIYQVTSGISFFCFSLTLHEIAAVLESYEESDSEENSLKPDEIREIIKIPPTDGGETDEDSDDENEGDLNHLTSAQLLTECDVVLVGKNKGNSNEETVNEPKLKSKKPKDKNRNWKETSKFDGDFVKEINNSDFVDHDEEFDTPVQCFDSMYNSDIIRLLVDMLNKYALQKNHILNVTEEEMKVYLAILLLTGYLTPRYIRMFWETKSDVHNELVANSIRRNRFLEIHQYLHTCDNLDLPEQDKFGKLRQYFDMLNESFGKNSVFLLTSNISIDETMVPYYGSHGSKQHIHGKPIRFGYKLWSACTPSGYLIHFIPYQGSKASQLPKQDCLGLGAAVVLNLLHELPKSIEHYSLHFDNFFTGLPLLDILSDMGHAGTGTIRENRTEKCPLPGSKLMKKRERGAMTMRTSRNIAVTQWNDNSIVTLASTSHGIEPVSKVDRIAVVDKKRTKINIPCPKAVSVYNKYMGGVDRFDENIQAQRVAFRGKKWWYPLFAFGLDAACHNAWKIHQVTGNTKMTYCEFRRSIVQGYLGTYKSPPKRCQSSGSVEQRVHKMVRRDLDGEHTREACKQSRCGECHERTRIKCKKCNVALHIHCWYNFHTKK